jgi:hypothetical protein
MRIFFMFPDRKALSAIFASAVVAGLAPAAHATTMGLSFQNTASGSTSNPSATTAFAPPGGSAFYGDTFNGPTTVIGGSPSPGYGFYDDFYFSVASGVATDSITSTINLGNLAINGLQVRLYDLTGNPPPVLGAPTHGTVVQSWSNPISPALGVTGDVEVLNTTLSQAGTYVLEVRGNVSGGLGGSYSGTLNVSPVPIPAALPLLLSGLGLFGGLARKRAAR